MLTKTVLTAGDLANMVDAVLEYNRKGRLASLAFFGPDGAPIALGWVEAAVDEPGLAVRSAPEPTQEEIVRAVNPPIEDPRKVAPAASMADLAALAASKP